MPPFPPQGPLGPFPRFIGTMRALRLLTALLAALRFLRLAIPFIPCALHLCVSCSCTSRRSLSASARRARGLFHRFPHPGFSGMETASSPRFLGDPPLHLPRSKTPAEPVLPGVCSSPGTAPTSQTVKASALFSLSRLNHAASAITTYASRLSRPSPRKARFRLLATLYRTGLVTCRATMKGFKISFPPSPGFPWRNRDLNFRKPSNRRKPNIMLAASVPGLISSPCSSANSQARTVSVESKQGLPPKLHLSITRG